MKVKKIEPRDKKEFQPFKIEVLVESKEDLLDLWHRFNIMSRTLKDDYHRKHINSHILGDNKVTSEIWAILEYEAIENGIREEV